MQGLRRACQKSIQDLHISRDSYINPRGIHKIRSLERIDTV